MSRADPLFVFGSGDFVCTESDEDFIAAGGFGEVFRACFASDKSHLLPDYHKEYLALKLVTGSRVNDRCRKSLEKEAAVLHQIPVHRNIVTLFGVLLHPKRFALVLEFMDGGSLAELLEDPPEYSWSDRLDACRQIACGMNHLHSLRLPVIHMDLSSANVLTDTTTSRRTYKIADFGLSKIRSISTSNVGSHSGYCGTVRFIAPERLAGGSIDVRGFPEMAMRADVYSFGIIMYHIKERHLPYKEEIDQVVIANVRDGFLPPLSDTSCPSGYNELMTNCYHKEAVCRPKFQAICVALDNLHFDSLGSCEASSEDTINRSACNNDFDSSPGLDSTGENYCRLLAFKRLMIGSGAEVRQLNASNTVQRKALSPEILLASFKKAKTGGLTRHLVPFMVDLLERGRSLDEISSCDNLNRASTTDITVDTIAETFPDLDEFCDYKHKELLIALLETCSEEHHSRIISLCGQGSYPCPFLYRRVCTDGQVEVRLMPEAYDDLFCVTEYPLALSCGTSNTSVMGKTDLLSLLFRMPSDAQGLSVLERSPGGPCHNLSVDFTFPCVLDSTLSNFVVADVHGFSADNATFKIGLRILASGTAINLIHVTSKDFTDSGKPNNEVKEIVSFCCDVSKNRKVCLMILWRDYTQQQTVQFTAAQQTMPQVLTNTNVTIRYFLVPDLRSLKDKRQCAKELTSAAVEILECGDKQNLPRMPNAREMTARYRALSNRGKETLAESDGEDFGDLLAFYKLMIGANARVAQVDTIVTLERTTLTPEIFQKIFKKAKGCGLTRYLATFMVDLLKRRRSLCDLTSYEELKKVSSSSITIDSIAKKIPELDDFFEYRHKELLIALLETFPEAYHSRIISLSAQAGCACPFLYQKVNLTGNKVEVHLMLQPFDDLFCLPKYPLALSCGTSGTSAMGKTELLSRLFGIQSEDKNASLLEISPGGPFHRLSIDIVFEGVLDEKLASFAVADVHGFSLSNTTFNVGVKVLASGANITLIHVTSENFTDGGDPDREVKEIVSNCSDILEGRRGCLAILWRDFTDQHADKFMAMQKAMPTALTCLTKPNVYVHYLKVPELRKLKSRRRGTVTRELTAAIVEMLSCGKQQKLPLMPSVRELVVKQQNALLGCTSHLDQEETDLKIESIGRNMKTILDRAKQEVFAASPPKTLFEFLFKASSIDCRLAEIEERGERLARQGELDDDGIAEIQQTRRVKSHCHTSDFVKYFCGLVAMEDITAINEFDRQLSIWKSPFCSPLVRKRTELHSKLEKTIMKLKDEEKGAETEAEVDAIQTDIRRNAEELERFDISIDDVWSELASLSSKKIEISGNQTTLLEKECGVKPTVVYGVFQQCVLSGHPMQLLRSHKLYIANDFLSAVLRRIQEQGSRKLFVVSVIGMQSSAKSTLLNYLFGCDFATRTGDCTKGLYASYIKTQDFEDFDLLVLDSEGLMSVEGTCSDFGKQMTLMVMACSHIVIINQKGQIDTQFCELLQVALSGCESLRFLSKPDVIFVLRDQVNLDDDAHKSQFAELNQTLIELKDKLRFQIKEYNIMDLSTNALHLFPSACIVQERNGRKLKQPTKEFSDMVLQLRGEIFRKQEVRFGRTSTLSKIGQNSTLSTIRKYGTLSKDFSTKEQWLAHVCAVWTTIRKYEGYSMYYERMLEIEQRREASSIFDKLVADEIESDQGFDSKCQKELQKFLSEAESDVASGSAGLKIQQALKDLEAQASAKTKLKTKLESGDYSRDLRQQFQDKLQTRIDEKKQGVLDAWANYESRVKSSVQFSELEAEIMKAMEDSFDQEGPTTRTGFDLKVSFDREWKEKLERKIEASMETDDQVQKKINSLFAEQIADHKKKEVYASLTPDVKGIQREESLLIAAAFGSGRWDKHLTVNRRWKEAQKWTSDHETKAKQSCLTVCRETAMHHFANLNDVFSNSQWILDTSFMRKVMWDTVSMVKTLKTKMWGISRGLLNLEISTFANDVHDCLRARIYKEYRKKQRREHMRKVDDLDQLKDVVRQRILRRRCGMEDDNSKAFDLAEDLRIAMLNKFLEKWAALFQAKIEQELRGKMSSARDAAKHAFEVSFTKEDWKAVVSYCQNPTGFLMSVFDKRFQTLSVDYKKQQLHDIFGSLKTAVDDFHKFLDTWEREWESRDDVRKTTKFLIDHCRQDASYFCTDDFKLVDFVSPNLTVTNPSVFVQAFLSASQTHLNIETLGKYASSLLADKLATVRRNIWETAKGCLATCPLCSSKCSLEADHLPHQKHECEIHFFPAFSGTSSIATNKLVFDVCTSKQSTELNEYIMPTASDFFLRHQKLRQFYYDHYPEWRVEDTVPLLEQQLHKALLQKAWVNTRAQILRLHSRIEDDTDPEWVRRYEHNPLT